MAPMGLVHMGALSILKKQLFRKEKNYEKYYEKTHSFTRIDFCDDGLR